MSKASSLLGRGTLIAAGIVGCVISASGATVSGCGGGIEPGEYVIYRISYAPTKQSSGCYPDSKVPAEFKSDSSSYRGSGNFIVFAGADEARYLDNGEVTLEGTETDDLFSFGGKVVDVEYAGTAKTTTTSTVTVDMTVDGESVSGTHTVKTVFKCSGSDQCPKSSTCTETTNFVGIEVEDVLLEHDADEGGEGGPSPFLPIPTTSGGGFGGGAGGVGGGTGGVGGDTGGTGGVGDCLTCSDFLTGQSGPPLCETSLPIATPLFTCVCNGSCSSSCSDLCTAGGGFTSECSSCASSSCPVEYDDCASDF